MKNSAPTGSSRRLSILGILAGTMAAARRFGNPAGKETPGSRLARPVSLLPAGIGCPPKVFGMSRHCAKLARKTRLRSAGVGGDRQ